MATRAQCDICLAIIDRPGGYQITTTQVVASPSYWDYYCELHQADLESDAIHTAADLATSPQRFTIAHSVAQESSSWMICDKCISRFNIDRGQASRYAHDWWARGGNYTLPGSGPAPLSAVRIAGQPLGEPPAEFQETAAALQPPARVELPSQPLTRPVPSAGPETVLPGRASPTPPPVPSPKDLKIGPTVDWQEEQPTQMAASDAASSPLPPGKPDIPETRISELPTSGKLPMPEAEFAPFVPAISRKPLLPQTEVAPFIPEVPGPAAPQAGLPPLPTKPALPETEPLPASSKIAPEATPTTAVARQPVTAVAPQPAAPVQPVAAPPPPLARGKRPVPGSGSLLQAFSSALLNLTGLGLGDFFLKRWGWGILFLAGTLVIIAGGVLLHAGHAPLIFLAFLAVWLLGATVAGALAGFDRRKGAHPWVAFGIAIVVLGIELAAVAGYFIAGTGMLAAAQSAYDAGDCRTALPLFDTFTHTFELTFNPDFIAAGEKVKECSLLIYAENMHSVGQYADTLSAYDTYLTLFPTTGKATKVAALEPAIYEEWGQNLRQAQDYSGAMEKYSTSAAVARSSGVEPPADLMETEAQVILEWGDSLSQTGNPQAAMDKYTQVMQDYGSTSASQDALTRSGDTLLAWGDQLRARGDLAGALEKYQKVLDSYPNSPAVTTALTRAGETLRSHGDELRQAGDFQGAIQNYQAVLDKYPQSDSAAGLDTLIPDVTVAWGDKLVSDGSFGDGLDKYDLVLNQYPAYPGAANLRTKASDTALKWADNLRQTGDFSGAVAQYKDILTRYPNTPNADQAQKEIPATLFDWANQLVQQKQYAQAMDQYAAIQKDYANTDVAKQAANAYVGVYIAWGKDLLAQGDFNASIDKYTQAKTSAKDTDVKKTADQGWTDAVTALAGDTGPQGQQAVSDAKGTACNFKPAASPAVGFIKTGAGTAYSCSSNISLAGNLYPSDPGHFRYAVTASYGSKNLQTCAYEQSHYLTRAQNYLVVKVIYTTTGGVYASTTIYGSTPGPCPSSHVFYGSTATDSGSMPGSNEANAWLSNVLR